VRDLVATGGVSVVLAQDRDRFAREPAYHYPLRKEFGEHGCRLKALNDRGDESTERSQSLYIPEYTVQEYLSNAFDKVGVRGSRALHKRLFFDQRNPGLIP
jgi:hypothetical protein